MNILHQPLENIQIALNTQLKFWFIFWKRVDFSLEILHVLHYKFQIASVVLLHFSVVIDNSNQELLVLEIWRKQVWRWKRLHVRWTYKVHLKWRLRTILNRLCWLTWWWSKLSRLTLLLTLIDTCSWNFLAVDKIWGSLRPSFIFRLLNSCFRITESLVHITWSCIFLNSLRKFLFHLWWWFNREISLMRNERKLLISA